jgi:hypothetical protein
MNGAEAPEKDDANRGRRYDGSAWVLLIFAAVEAVALALVVFKLLKS